MWFWFAFPLWPEMLSIASLYVVFFWPFILSLKNFCSVHLPIFSLDHWFFGSLVFWAPCKFWLFIPCQILAGKCFFPFCRLSLQSVTTSFVVQKLFSFTWPHLSSLSLNHWAIGVYLGSYCLFLYSSIFPLLFLSSFKVSGLILRSLINFELMFIQDDSSFRWI
jgi:hypothetical protein